MVWQKETPVRFRLMEFLEKDELKCRGTTMYTHSTIARLAQLADSLGASASEAEAGAGDAEQLGCTKGLRVLLLAFRGIGKPSLGKVPKGC